jgi:hypothetical protein
MIDLVLALLLTGSSGVSIAGPTGWQPMGLTSPTVDVLGVWRAPIPDADVPFRANVSLVHGHTSVADEEQSRDAQLAHMGATLVRDRATTCVGGSSRVIEYVLTRPQAIDSIVLVMPASGGSLVATYDRVVGTNADLAATAWMQQLCNGSEETSHA